MKSTIKLTSIVKNRKITFNEKTTQGSYQQKSFNCSEKTLDFHLGLMKNNPYVKDVSFI